MTPGARLAAAAGVLDEVLAGASAERTLTNWARGARYAGSKDRAAVRDIVFDALRKRRSLAWLGGSETGRGLVIGSLRDAGLDPEGLMTGQGHALPPPTPEESPRDLAEAPPGVRLDMADWLLPRLADSLGADLGPACQALAARGPVTLRANLRKTSRDGAQAALGAEGIETRLDPDVPTALHVTTRNAKVTGSASYLGGLVEVQDASSQAAVLRLPLRDGDRVLDLCAGGGGKSLAMGPRAELQLFAHDAALGRMADLPVRAARAGLTVALCQVPETEAPFDLVYVDAPCSGSGTWRRSPEAKWRLTPERLESLCALQDAILDRAASVVRPGGHLAFATCSVLREEGSQRIEAFLARAQGWQVVDSLFMSPGPRCDGFSQSVLQRL